MFDVDRVDFRPPDGGEPAPFYRIESPDWINVVPIDRDGRVVLIRQYRFGVESFTLEIPGGMCDPGESPAVSARRELLEETGYAPGELIDLGWVHPNPAVQSNRCHTFLARDAHRVAEPSPDEHEAFEVSLVERAAIRGLIAGRQITHALVVSAFQLLDVHESTRR